MSYNYLRRFRKRDTFTQAEIAYLLGILCDDKVSRFERLKALPNLRTALAYQLIYDMPIHDLFPRLHQDISGELVGRSHQLMRRLNKCPDCRHVPYKMRALKNIVTRL